MSNTLINPWLRLIRLKEFKKTLRVVPYNIARDSTYIYHEDMSKPYQDEIVFQIDNGEIFIDGFVVYKKMEDGKEQMVLQKSIQSIRLIPGDLFKINLKNVQFVGI